MDGFTLWFTGLSGSGKSSLAERIKNELVERGMKVELLDGDEFRTTLSKGLGFSKEDRDTNIRRIGYVAKLLTRNGVVAITAAISPYRDVRDEQRQKIGRFFEVYTECDLDTLEKRDVKDARPPSDAPGTLICNPPYGERIGEEKELIGLYQRIGRVAAEHWRGWKLFVFTSNTMLAKKVGLKVVQKTPFFNGSLECFFHEPMRDHLAADLRESRQPVGDGDEAVFIDRRQVAGDIPAVPYCGGGQIFPA